MFQTELLISLLNKIRILCTIGFLCFLSACNTVLVSEQEAASFYVDSPNEFTGMLIRNNLLVYFPNTNASTARYFIRIQNNVNKTLFLTASTGYATKGKIVLTVNINVFDSYEQKNVISYKRVLEEPYNIDLSGFSVRQNEQKAIDTLSSYIANDLYTRVYRYMYITNTVDEPIEEVVNIDEIHDTKTILEFENQ